MNLIGKLLKEKRNSDGLSQIQLAKSLGMSITTYNGLETGKAERNAQRKTIRKVAAYLCLDEAIVWRALNDRD